MARRVYTRPPTATTHCRSPTRGVCQRTQGLGSGGVAQRTGAEIHAADEVIARVGHVQCVCRVQRQPMRRAELRCVPEPVARAALRRCPEQRRGPACAPRAAAGQSDRAVQLTTSIHACTAPLPLESTATPRRAPVESRVTYASSPLADQYSLFLWASRALVELHGSPHCRLQPPASPHQLPGDSEYDPLCSNGCTRWRLRGALLSSAPHAASLCRAAAQ